MQKHARTLLFASFIAVAFALLPASAGATPAVPGRAVYLARDLDDEQLIVLGSTLAGSGKPATLLMDSPRLSSPLKAYLAEIKPEVILPVADTEGLQRLSQTLYTKPATVVICPPRPRGQLLQAACLAGSLQAPLYVCNGRPGETTQLHKRLTESQTKQVYLIGDSRELANALPPMQVHKLADEEAVAAAHVKLLAKQGHVETLIIANPRDYLDNPQPMSPLSPWLAIQKRAALLLTNEAGDDVEEIVKKALRQEALKKVENVIFVADLNAIPLVSRPNPIPTDKDALIEMEPLTPSGSEPFTFAVGRIFHDDNAVVPLMLARQQLLASATGPRRALVASNPGGSLPLLETFSRNTVKELSNAGYKTTARFRNNVEPDELRRLMTQADIFLWEGHHNTLVREWGFPTWDEPLPPSLVFLQSCLALKEAKVQPLFQRGAVAVVGSSTRTYSASGGACSLAFFNALAYEDQSLGGSLRQSKNFLLAYSLLKEKRLGEAATRSGANQRAAWAFTLWGDPTLKLPRPATPEHVLPHIRTEVVGNRITIALPAESHSKVTSATKYQTEMLPNARLAGLLKKEKDDDGQALVPFVFAEVALPKARPGCRPLLHSKIPSSRWVFVYDERRNAGYLLITPRTTGEQEMRFNVEWLPVESAKRATPATTGSGQ